MNSIEDGWLLYEVAEISALKRGGREGVKGGAVYGFRGELKWVQEKEVRTGVLTRYKICSCTILSTVANPI